MILPEKIFITGTDTGIGKTLVSAVITAGRNGYYWKPIQSGLEDMTDTEWVKSVSGLPDTHFLKEAYRLNSPLSPHISAKLDGISIDPDLINLPDKNEPLVIEGAGGVMVPLNADFFMLDLMRKFCLPVLVVARSGLGTINHTLLTVDTLKRSGLEIIGVVMNGPVNPRNRETIEKMGQVRVVAEIEPVPVINRSVLIEIYERFFNG